MANPIKLRGVLADFNAWSLLGSLVPFVILFGFWMFVMRKLRNRPTPGQEQLVAKLEEIRAELERVRRAIESRS